MGRIQNWGDVAGAAAGVAGTAYGAGLAVNVVNDLAQLAFGNQANADRSAQWVSGWQRTLQQRGQLPQPQEKPQP